MEEVTLGASPEMTIFRTEPRMLAAVRRPAIPLLLLLGLVSCGTSASAPAGPGAPATEAGPGVTIQHFSRVAVIVMENREFGDVIGSSNAPYVNSLANRSGLVTRFYGISHPSLPNYLAMIGGSTFGIHSDCTACHVGSRNLVDQLAAHGISWKAYMEDMPSPCYGGATHHDYAKRHDPFLYFDDIRNNRQRCGHVVPFKQLGQDLSTNSLPQFVFVTPNVCHDMHDCSTATGDAFLKRRVPPLLRRLGPNGVLFLLWDEGYSNDGCWG